MNDELDSLSYQELEILLDFFNTKYFDVLKKYRILRDNYCSKLAKTAHPTTGEIAMWAFGDIQGRDLEIRFFFDKLQDECKANLKKRNQPEKQKITSYDPKNQVNPLTGI